MKRKVHPRCPPVPPPPEPGQYPWCRGIPDPVLREVAARLVEDARQHSEPLPWSFAVLDYLSELAQHGQELLSLDQRARRWGWELSKAAMSRRMTRLREDARDWSERYRTKWAAHRLAAASPLVPSSIPVQDDESDPIARAYERQRSGRRR